MVTKVVLRAGHANPNKVVLRDPTSVTTVNIYTPVVGGTISFSGIATTTFIPVAGGPNTYTPTVGGTINFSGTASIARTKVALVSGQVTFSGAAQVSRVRSYQTSGQITFQGSAGVARTIRIEPTGGILFSGQAAIARTIAPVLSGNVVFSGAANTRFVPVGGGGVPVRFYNGVSKAPMSGISVLPYVAVDTGGGNYEVTYNTGVSDNKTDSASYEGIELL
jgi:hypothetical protein